MAELTTVARPYAEAAFRASVDAKDVTGYGEKLALFGAAAANREVASLIGNPKVSTTEKAELLFSVAGGNVPDVLKNLVNTLVENQGLDDTVVFALQTRKMFTDERQQRRPLIFD